MTANHTFNKNDVFTWTPGTNNISGVVSGHNLVQPQISLEYNEEGTFTYTNTSAVGDFVVPSATIYDDNSADVTGNYAVSYDLTVKVGVVNILYTARSVESDYDGKAKEISIFVVESLKNEVREYSLDGKEWSTTHPVCKDVGRYTIYFKISADGKTTGVAARRKTGFEILSCGADGGRAHPWPLRAVLCCFQ